MSILRTLSAAAAVAILIPMFSSAQIPNPGFEQWSAGSPDGWVTNNLPGFVVPITQSSTAHGGSSAARGEVLTFSGMPYGPIMYAGSTARGFPVTQRHASLTGFYRFTPVGGDVVIVIIDMTRADTLVGLGDVVLGAAASYTQFTAPITYFSAERPDTCFIAIIVYGDSSGGPAHVGSVMLIDDLAFSGISAVNSDATSPGEF
ncbi:MAG: hypothetical protein AAB393_05585, partial [Bacteroidota bacterium]